MATDKSIISPRRQAVACKPAAGRIGVDTGAACAYCEATMKILVIGGGGREHALAWKLRQSPAVEKLWCAPGQWRHRAGRRMCPWRSRPRRANSPIWPSGSAPISPSSAPICPFRSASPMNSRAAACALVGPRRQAAQLEGSKIFAKEFMARHAIPTGRIYGVCDSAADAYKVVAARERPGRAQSRRPVRRQRRAGHVVAGRSPRLHRPRHGKPRIRRKRRPPADRRSPHRPASCPTWCWPTASTSSPSLPAAITSAFSTPIADRTPAAWAPTPATA